MITALVIHSGLPLSRFFSAGALPWCCAALSTRAHNRMAKTSAGDAHSGRLRHMTLCVYERCPAACS